MTHFTVLVVGPNIESQLAPFDEDIKVPQYIRNTRQELIEQNRRNINRTRDGDYSEYLADSEAYLEKHKSNPSRCLYFTSGEFAEKLNWSDEQLYQDAIQYVEEDKIDSEGNELSTYNPNSKWDWYQIGGRWDGALKTKDGKTVNETTVGEIDISDFNGTFAVLKDGQWYEKGSMGWFGMSDNKMEDEEWNLEFRRLIAELPPETPLTLVDAHI